MVYQRRAVAALLVILCFFSGTAVQASPVPDNTTKIAGFIYVPGQNGQAVPNGTCFFITIESKASPGKGWGYLVTAKHVLRDVHGDYFPTVWVRINKQAGGVESISVTLIPVGPNKNVFVNDDSSVDLAVVPVSQPDPKIYDVVPLPDTLLSSK
jgi:hypothetical protein